MKKLIFLIPIIFIIIAVLLFSLGSKIPATQTKTIVPTPTKIISNASFPEQTVLNFFDSYLKFEGNGFASKIYENSPYLTEELKKKLDDMQSQTLMYDPIICAQNTPLSIKIDKAQKQGNNYLVNLTEIYGSGTVSNQIVLIKDKDVYEINKIICANP